MYTNQLTKYLINQIKSIDSNYTPQTIIDAGPRELDQSNALETFFDNNNFTHEFHLPFEGPPHAFMEGELVCINKKLFKK
jgi:hypothetical protein